MKNTSNKRLTKKRQLMIKKLGYLQIGLLVLMFAVAGIGARTPKVIYLYLEKNIDID